MDLRIPALLIILCALLQPAYAKDYSLDSASVDYVIARDGSVRVYENVTYSLSGCFNELFVQLPPKYVFEGRTYDFTINNANGYCVGASCVFRVDQAGSSVSGDTELVLALSDNKCDSTVSAVYYYEFSQVILGSDDAQFYYKLWGDKWDKPVDLTASVTLPGDAGSTQYFIHPWGLKTDASTSGNTLTIKTHQPANTFLEINILMPKNWFEQKGNYFVSTRTKQNIIDAEDFDRSNYDLLKNIIEPLVIAGNLILAVLPIILFVLIYYRYGREIPAEELGYSSDVYERDPPSGHLPEEAGFFLHGDFQEKAFVAGLMYLVYKKYLDIQERSGEVFIQIRKAADADLKEHQRVLLDIVNYKAKGATELDFKVFRERSHDEKLFEKYTGWKATLEKETGINKYIDNMGRNLYTVLYVAILLFASGFNYLLMPVLFPAMGPVAASIQAAAPAAFFILGLLCLLASKKIVLSRWTREGRLLNLKWTNFKRYLEDFSYLKEHPPESIKLWDFYMAYAISFGVAEKTIKAMKETLKEQGVPQTEVRSLAFAGYPAFYGYSAGSHFSPPQSSGSFSGGGGFGGSGGGGGGGGGGAR